MKSSNGLNRAEHREQVARKISTNGLNPCGVVRSASRVVLNEADIAHRKIASQKITINAIRLLDHDQLDRLQDVLNHIAEDREYYMPERRYGMGR